jgi:tetratricopeptide (TPR) repeat protein
VTVLTKPHSPVMVGRERELARLEAAILTAARGETRVAVISGEAGVGKSRLVTEAARRASSLAMPALKGECSESDLSLPYLPLVEAFSAYLAGDRERHRVRETLGDAIGPLSRVFPQLSGARDGFQGTGTALDKLRLFESFLALVRTVAASDGLVLIVEDVHWIDSATQELLDYLVRRLERAGTLMLLTVRDTDLPRSHSLHAPLRRWLRAGAEEVALRPLAVEAVAAMTSAILDVESTPQNIAARLHERSDGVPFALEELLQQALESGVIAGAEPGQWSEAALSDLPPPRSIADNILTRSERLNAVQLDALRCAAVLGRSFDFGVLQRMSGEAPESLIDALDACARMQMIEQDPRRDNGYRFRHVLIRDAIYNDILVSRRRLMHARAADAIRAAGSDDPAELAHHLIAAGNTDEAARACADAAAAALQRLAPREAVELFTLALRNSRDPRDTARLRCSLGEAAYQAGDIGTAHEHLEAGVAALQDIGDTLLAAHHRLALGRCLVLRSQYAEATRQYEIARGDLEVHGPSEDLALAYIRLAGMRASDLEPADAERMAERALHVADACGCVEHRIAATDWLGMSMCLAGKLDTGLAELDRSRNDARVRGLHLLEANVAAHTLSVLETYGRVAACAPLMERLRALNSDPWIQVVLPYYESWLALWAGQLVDAARAAQRCVEAASGFGMASQAAWGRGVQCVAATELGDLESARRLLPVLDHPLQRQEQLEQGWATLRFELAAGEIEAAMQVAARLAAAPSALAGTVLTDTVVEALLTAGRITEARQLVEVIAAEPRSAMHDGHLLRARGRLALAEGPAKVAVEALGPAIDAYASGGYRLEVLRTRVLLSDALGRAGRVDEAASSLRVTAREAVSAGAALVLSAAQGVAAAAGVDLGVAVSERTPLMSVLAPVSRSEFERAPAEPSAEERAVTVLVMQIPEDVGAATAAEQGQDRLASIQRWFSLAVEQHRGTIDEAEGTVLTATFNRSGWIHDHARHAVEAAVEVAATAARSGAELRAGVAVGPAPAAMRVSERDVLLVGSTADTAAALLAHAGAGDILMTDETERLLPAELRASLGAAQPVMVAVAGLDRTVPSRRFHPSTAAARATPREPATAGPVGNSLVREGELWSMTFAGTVIRLRDAKGMRDLARLLAAPGTEIASVDLAGAVMAVPGGRRRTAAMTDLGIEGDVGEVLDGQARSEYRRRLVDLEQDLADAEEANDPERASRIRQERSFIIDELGAAVGLMGKSRRALDPAERARKAVTWRLRDAIGRIDAAHPELGRHLQHSVRTGTFCVYDPVTPTRWTTRV